MITRDLRTLERRDNYRILSSLVVPRPIAWVTTLGEAGQVNLAPFSSFMGIFDPPALALNLSHRRDGSPKDTLANLRARREAVVHLADLPLLEALHASGEEVPPEESELQRLGLAIVPSQAVAVPRLADAPVALECRLRREVSLVPTSDVVFLDVLIAHAQDRLWDEALDCARGDRWEPLARLIGGGVDAPNYAGLGPRFTLGKPKLPGGGEGD
jgi:flavin reductase (DIM6/NTAB) family NADH-FMN oxidoreductase RutF